MKWGHPRVAPILCVTAEAETLVNGGTAFSHRLGNAQFISIALSTSPVGIRRLFSDEVEIEHILPFALTLDDSPTNLTVALRRANRDKDKRTPYDAFGTSPVLGGHKYDWDAIALRASALPRSKQWRFRADPMELIRDKLRREEERQKGSLPGDVLADIEKTGGFLARQLVDTAYLARVSRQYLTSLVPAERDEDGTLRSNVWVVPGGMTGMLRRLWGLNRYLWGNRRDAQDEGPDDWRGKLRTDHRQHAVDAFVLTLIDRSLLQAIQHQSGQSGHRTISTNPGLAQSKPPPGEGFRSVDCVRQGVGLHRLRAAPHQEIGLTPTQCIYDKIQPFRFRFKHRVINLR